MAVEYMNDPTTVVLQSFARAIVAELSQVALRTRQL